MTQSDQSLNTTPRPILTYRSPIRRALASLRAKTILAIALALIVMLLIGTIPLQNLVLSGFLQLEEQAMRVNLERIDKAIQVDIDQIDKASLSWATWDDTYAFAEKPTQDYITINTSDNWFQQYHFNIMLFANTSGQVLFSKYYDLERQAVGPSPQALLSQLTPTSALFHHDQPDSRNVGIMVLPEGPLLVVARPILTSAGTGPIHGTVLFGRYLDQAEVTELTKVTQLPFTVSRIDTPSAPTDIQVARTALLGSGQPVIRPLNDTSIVGYGLLKDINGQPALMTRLEVSRDIYNQGLLEMRYLTLALVAGGVLIGIVMLILTERLVLRRLITLDDRVARIGSDGDLAARVVVAGNDELAHLGSSINTMLDAQAHTQAERAQLEQARINDLERTAAEQRELVEQLQASLIEREALSQTVQELSAPIIPVLPGTIVVPLVGSFDSGRAGELQRIVLEETQVRQASCVIIDVTGVRMFDTAVAQIIIHLATALRLLGAEVVLVGIRPEIAQTLVQLGITLNDQRIAADLKTAIMSIAARSVVRR